MSTVTQDPPVADPLLALLADAGAPTPAEVLLGTLTGPARLATPDDAPPGSGRGVAVLFWRGSVHVLGYDREGGGCPRCLCWFLTRQVVPRPAAPYGEPADDTARARAAAETLWHGLTPALRAVVGGLAALLLRGDRPGGSLVTVDRASGTVQPGRIPPRAGCPGCPPSTATTAVTFDTEPASLVKAEGTLRTRAPLPATLASDYVGPHALFRSPLVDLDGPVPAAQVHLPLGNGDLEPGIGRSHTFTASRRTAVLEGLERYTGFHYRPSQGIVEATLGELGARAIDPRTLGYHADEQYAREDFPFAPLGAEETVRWVPVTPLGEGPARHLPEPALTWVRPDGARKPFFYDTSNGFALGQSPEEATLHGILEVVERDAFLLTWYRRLVLPELVIGPADRALRDLVERVDIVTGFRVRLFWAALDTGIPVVLALAQRDAATGPCTFVSTGAGLDPRRAAESAIFEVAAILSAVTHSFEENLAHAARLADDFHLVRTMADHSLLGALPGSRPWFDFLSTPDRPTLGFAEAAAAVPVSATLGEDLDHVRTRIEAVGAHIYVADVTTPELRWRGLQCTRTFIPGFLPMTFGHDTRRLVGLPRLDRAPLPYASLLPPGRSAAEVPPHPFP
ncbi:YcaO-like family protein [Streptomyces sp. ASQP_92]|uniref:YcaO-like family protein n=1 Tax=Streptomyces sp. ASQP_92 TaxID=2979116 RepID=UPI0021BECA5D|nr:YcaO-like family protein [Streptomyces sp. ASQP_92]MCT9089599.1 YcaO-like family protein [Streptomyces sp. ASQP_92]